MSVWDDPQAEEMLRRFAGLGLSGGAISERMDDAGITVSRSAVLAKLKRLGLTSAMRAAGARADGGQEGGRSASARRKTAAAKRKRKAQRAAPTPVDLAGPVPGGVALLEARADACRWPVAGEGIALRVCGARTVPGPYCPACRRIAYSRPEPAGQSARAA